MDDERHPINSPESSSTLSSIMQRAREKAGYNVEDLALATGLTQEEITNIEIGRDQDEGRLRRVAAVLKIAL